MFRKHVSALSAVLLLTFMAGACASTDQDATAPEGAPREDDEPRRGGILVLPVQSDVTSLDPHRLVSTYTHEQVGLVYNRLLRFATGPDVDEDERVLEPELANDWEISEDGLTYTFTLRAGVRWQDVAPVNGRPFVADDVVATFERILSLPGFQRYMLQGVSQISAPDPQTVVLRLTEPFAPLLTYMASHHMWILPREGVEGLFDLNVTAVGTGPFIMTSREPQVATVYSRNPDYFIEGQPYLDGIRRLTIGDSAARVAAFRAGESDVLLSASADEIEAVERTNPDAVRDTYPSGGLNYLWVNVAAEPFDDVRVRKALSLAIDRREMGPAIYGEGGSIPGIMPPGLGQWALPEAERNELYRHDVAAARELLALAGYPDGFQATILVTPQYGRQLIQMAEWIVQDLQAIGIEAELESQEYSTVVGTRLPQRQYELAVNPQTPYQEPDEWLRAQLHSSGGRNWYGISDPKLDMMLEEQAATASEEDRIELVHEIERYVADEVASPIPLWSQPTTTLRQPRVKGWYPTPAYGYPWMQDVWLDDE